MTHDDDMRNIKDILNDFLRSSKLDKKLLPVRVKAAWNELMKHSVAPYTSKIDFKHGVLTIRLTSATLREELFREKQKIIDLMNGHLGENIIQDIRFL